MRRLLVLAVGLLLLVPGSSILPSTASSVAGTIGCVDADASFTAQAYCLDGNHADVLANPAGALTGDAVDFGVLQLNGWQVPTRCNGDGVSGKREQLVYAHVKGAPNLSTQAIPFLKQRLVPGANGVFEHTSGGKRAIRWVTRRTASGCVPTVLGVTVPAAANASRRPFNDIGRAVLAAVGGVRADRSYLVMVDSPDLEGDCGLGQVRQDSSAGPGNRNNSGGAFAMVWANCWSGLVAAHELTHTMGAVQPEAPHHTARGHCWDGRDAMCYDDGSPQQQRLVCSRADDFRKLDCDGNDYFALHPKAGSYLATHWNSASSQFLISSRATVLPTRPGQPTGVAVTPVDATHVRVSWTAGPTKHGALVSWTVLVGATDGGTAYDENASYAVTNSTRQVRVGAKARSALVAVKSNVVQGFAVLATNGSGDGVTSAIVTGGTGTPPSPIAATYRPDPIAPDFSGVVSWSGGASPAGVNACTAVLVNGARLSTYDPPLTVEQSTDPDGPYCQSDPASGTTVYNLRTADVLQVLARNSFGRQLVTVAHP